MKTNKNPIFLLQCQCKTIAHTKQWQSTLVKFLLLQYCKKPQFDYLAKYISFFPTKLFCVSFFRLYTVANPLSQQGQKQDRFRIIVYRVFQSKKLCPVTAMLYTLFLQKAAACANLPAVPLQKAVVPTLHKVPLFGEFQQLTDANETTDTVLLVKLLKTKLVFQILLIFELKIGQIQLLDDFEDPNSLMLERFFIVLSMSRVQYLYLEIHLRSIYVF